jgi:hypothetical protein
LTTTPSVAFGVKSRIDSPTIENHSGLAGSRGFANSSPVTARELAFVTVNDAFASPESSRFTAPPAAVTEKLSGRSGTGQPSTDGSDPDAVANWKPRAAADATCVLMLSSLGAAACVAVATWQQPGSEGVRSCITTPRRCRLCRYRARTLTPKPPRARSARAPRAGKRERRSGAREEWAGSGSVAWRRSCREVAACFSVRADRWCERSGPQHGSRDW